MSDQPTGTGTARPDDAPAGDAGEDRTALLRRLPGVDAILRHPAAETPRERFGRPRLVEALRRALDAAREAVLDGEPVPDVPALLAAATEDLEASRSGSLRRVLNATGVVLHTNLGRAPLSAAAREAVARAAGYTTVEYDLDGGGRGSRTAHPGVQAARACGTEAATAVNNGAAALMLTLAALAGGRETIVSRGELIEVGGSYRLPDVMATAGTVLREVGTTNRTRIGDYRAAAGEDTGLLLKVHQSNYRVTGFAGDTPPAELAELAGELGVPFVYDLGSGLLRSRREGPLSAEPSVADAVEAGADLVIFSGDKLLGGPQAGVIAGREGLVTACERHPMARAVRIDKLQRAALEATLSSHLRAGGDPPVDLPVFAMLAAEPGRLRERAGELARNLGRGAEPVEVTGVVGGGSVPGAGMPGWGVALDGGRRLAAALRAQDPPVVGRLDDDRVVLDLRTIPPSDDTELADLVLGAMMEG